MSVPANPKIYHIVHVERLPSIVADGGLWSDAVMATRSTGPVIGNQEIKADRLQLPVHCHAGTRVGDYVPFYFCPRSVMLYVISKRNHPNVAFQGGQDPVVHLLADMHEVIRWADASGRPWAFSDINAANRAAEFYCDLDDLGKLNWNAIQEKYWTSCRDHKMAEFLVHGQFSWELVRGIGVRSRAAYQRVSEALKGAGHKPRVEIKPDWYY